MLAPKVGPIAAEENISWN